MEPAHGAAARGIRPQARDVRSASNSVDAAAAGR